MKSDISGFYKLSMRDRRRAIASLTGLDENDVAVLSPPGGLSEPAADRMVENAIGVLGLPLGVCVNMRISLDGAPARDLLVPMAIEEPSVIAACSYAAKLLRAGGGVVAESTEPLMIGQIQVMDVPDHERAAAAVMEREPELLASANAGHPQLVRAGGGARAIELRALPASDSDDPCGPMLIVHLVVDVRDAMGANAINSMCERLAPSIAALTGGRVGLRILSNLTDRRTVKVTGRVPLSALEGQGAESGEALARGIEEASVFAERCSWRAATHNKGIMNGVDAVLLALGQDWRAVEAGAHAFAARSGRYSALARWRAEDGALVGRMEIPMAVGTVGGVIRVHPVVQTTRKLSGIESALELGAVTAAAGLAQNLGALRALAAEGIQSGHMRLHARNVAVEAGAIGHEVDLVATRIADQRAVNIRAAREALLELRSEKARSLSLEHATELAPRRPRPARPPVPPPSAARAIGTAGRESDVRHPETPMTASSSTQSLQPFRQLGGRVFVTGGAGHLGANLVRRLLEDGREVRALVREGSNNAALDGLPIERVTGDLRDAARMRELMRGCQTAYHVAAMVSTVVATPQLEREIFECNVLGTRNLLRAAMDNHLERVVVTGSFSAVGYDPEDPQRPGNESDVFYPFDDVLPYARTKVQVEHECLKACAEGLDVVVATSCAVLGPHDYKPSRMGLTLIDYANGRLPAYVPGGFDFVAARDICEGHVLAMHRGRRGQKYIISTKFMTVDDLMGIFEEVSGRPRPRFRLPGPLMQSMAAVSQVVYDTVAPNAPRRFTPAAVRILRMARRADTTKAQTELGFVPGDVRRAIHEAYADFARRGLVPSRPGLAAFEPREPWKKGMSRVAESAPPARAVGGE